MVRERSVRRTMRLEALRREEQWRTEDLRYHLRVRHAFAGRGRHELRREIIVLRALRETLDAERSDTVKHDPDAPEGCVTCPLFEGVPRDGSCRSVGTLHLESDDEGWLRFAAPKTCPLRHGIVVVTR